MSISQVKLYEIVKDNKLIVCTYSFSQTLISFCFSNEIIQLPKRISFSSKICSFLSSSYLFFLSSCLFIFIFPPFSFFTIITHVGGENNNQYRVIIKYVESR